jgi:hypothetical protein
MGRGTQASSNPAAGAAIPSGLTRGSTLSTGDPLTTLGFRIRELLVPLRVERSDFDPKTGPVAFGCLSAIHGL